MNSISAKLKPPSTSGSARRRILCHLLFVLSFESSLPALTAAQPKEAPQRVISQVPAITEILYALGQEDRIVGVSKYCRFPPDAQNKPKIGGFHDASLESIIALKPDWIALFQGQDELKSVLEPIGCRVFSPTMETIADVCDIIRQLGSVFGASERAEGVVASMEKDIDAIKTSLADLPRRRTLFVVGREPGSFKGLYCVGKGGFVEEMLNAAGAESALAQEPVGRYPILSLETLMRVDPEVILDCGASPADVEAGRMPSEWQAFASLQAVHRNQVVPVHDDHLTIPGPSIPSSVRKLACFIHGASAEERLASAPKE